MHLPIPRSILAALTLSFTAMTSSVLAQEDGPPTLTLEEMLSRPNSHVVMFTPTRMSASHQLELTHVRVGDGSVKPGENKAVMLVVFASKANQDGTHTILFQDFHRVEKGGSPVLRFAAFKPATSAQNFIEPDGRCGIIAILIGLNQPGRSNNWKTAPLPAQDVISMEINPGGEGIGLLLPAVQKVRAAAARL